MFTELNILFGSTSPEEFDRKTGKDAGAIAASSIGVDTAAMG
jgi:hypothetical protein